MTEDTTDARSERLEAAIRQARLIIPSLAVGALIFAAVVLAMNAARGPMLPGNQTVPAVLGVFSAVILVIGVLMGFVMARGLDAKARAGEETPIGQVFGVVIAGAALIEAPALLAAVTAMLGGLPYLFITLVGCAILLVQWMRVADRMRDMAGLSTAYTLR